MIRKITIKFDIKVSSRERTLNNNHLKKHQDHIKVGQERYIILDKHKSFQEGILIVKLNSCVSREHIKIKLSNSNISVLLLTLL